MANLKVYDWEAERWPEFQNLPAPRNIQEATIIYLADRFELPEPELRQSYRRGGAGKYNRKTETIRLGKNVMLSDVIHEFAHHMANRVYDAKGHGQAFKKCLGICYAAMIDRWNAAKKEKAQEALAG